MKLSVGKRSLVLQKSGGLFMLLCFSFGLLAMIGSNNVLYLYFSSLLGIVTVSAVYSEWSLAGLVVSHLPRQHFAGDICADVWIVENRGLLPVINFEVGEFISKKTSAHFTVSLLKSGEKRSFSSTWSTSQRGEHAWHGFYVSSAAPFGFATRIVWINDLQKRLVWPSRKFSQKLLGSAASETLRSPQQDSYTEGETRLKMSEDSWKQIVWSKSDPTNLRVRPRENSAHQETLELDMTREWSDVELENYLSFCADYLAKHPQCKLKIIYATHAQTFTTMLTALNALAVLERPRAHAAVA